MTRAKKMLAGQAKLSDNPFDFKDNSVKDHLTGDWKEKVQRRMENVIVVIVLCEAQTHTASGVSSELTIAKDKTAYRLDIYILRANAAVGLK